MTFGKSFIALRPTTLAFARGEFAVLLGSSGAGKSTLLRCINLLNRPTTGTLSVEGIGTIPLRGSALRDHRRNTAMIFQQHQLINRASALQNVLVGRLAYYSAFRTLLPFRTDDKRLALECLERVGLLEKALDRVDNLSGGQQQRVGIARGLAQQPRVILADEPVASLDPATANRVLADLRRICKEDQLTAVVSLHQVELAKAYADRIIGLAAGEVVFDGATSDLTEADIHRIYSTASTDPIPDQDIANGLEPAFAFDRPQ